MEETEMPLIINGTARELNTVSTVAALLEALRLSARQVAVERNGAIVPRSRFADNLLQDGDHIEIVQLIGGG